MKTISMGTKKKQFKSIRLAADQSNCSYICLYMRLRAGMSLPQAMNKPVRVYRKKASEPA